MYYIIIYYIYIFIYYIIIIFIHYHAFSLQLNDNIYHLIIVLTRCLDTVQARIDFFSDAAAVFEFVADRKKRRINGRVCTYRNEGLLSVASASGPHTRASRMGGIRLGAEEGNRR